MAAVIMSDGTSQSEHPDELALEATPPGRRRVIAESVYVMLSHHPPALHGHCLRLTLRGHSLYLCGRCTGIYGGLIVGLAIILFGGLSLEPAWLWYSVAVTIGLATVIDWMTQRLTPRKTTVRLRFLTGFASGIGLAIIFLIRDVLYVMVALVVMMASVGLVSLAENRMKSPSRPEGTV